MYGDKLKMHKTLNRLNKGLFLKFIRAVVYKWKLFQHHYLSLNNKSDSYKLIFKNRKIIFIIQQDIIQGNINSTNQSIFE